MKAEGGDADVTQRLWASQHLVRARRGPADLLVLPSRRRPRMLVPSGERGAARMLSRHATSPVRRAVQTGLVLGQRTGLLGLLPVSRVRMTGADGAAQDPPPVAELVRLCRATIPEARHVGVLLGPPRANAKPVLQVFDAAGRTVAFGKVGTSALTARLVRAEARALEDLCARPVPGLVTPRLLHETEWRGHPLLLMTALASSQRHDGATWRMPVRATRALARSRGVRHHEVASSPYVTALDERVLELGDDQVRAELDLVHEDADHLTLAHGAWHGDWAPWNMATSGDEVQVWDWERWSAEVPMGFDAVHFAVQELLSRGRAAEPDAGELVAALLRGPEPWHADEQVARAVVRLYLLDVVCRYSLDARETSTAAPVLGRRTQVLLRLVVALRRPRPMRLS